jgi:predicted ATP-grasp superfamily ATP-dependent carboligase
MPIPNSTIQSVQNLINSWDIYISKFPKALYTREFALYSNKGGHLRSGGKAALQAWFDKFIKPNAGGTDIQPTVTFPDPGVKDYRSAWMQSYTQVRQFLLAITPVGEIAVQQLDKIYSDYTKYLGPK